VCVKVADLRGRRTVRRRRAGDRSGERRPMSTTGPPGARRGGGRRGQPDPGSGRRPRLRPVRRRAAGVATQVVLHRAGPLRPRGADGCDEADTPRSPHPRGPRGHSTGHHRRGRPARLLSLGNDPAQPALRRDRPRSARRRCAHPGGHQGRRRPASRRSSTASGSSRRRPARQRPCGHVWCLLPEALQTGVSGQGASRHGAPQGRRSGWPQARPTNLTLPRPWGDGGMRRVGRAVRRSGAGMALHGTRPAVVQQLREHDWPAAHSAM
jgi:hypothetical protein